MQDKEERLISAVYKRWREAESGSYDHPDIEALTSFLEGKLSEDEGAKIEEHILHCHSCAEALSFSIKLETSRDMDVPEGLLEKVKGMVLSQDGADILEIWLKLKDAAIELMHTTGDVLVGRELVPAPVLRSRSIKDFKDEINILKDFGDIRTEIKVENKGKGIFNLKVAVKEKSTQRVMKDLRVTLIKEDLELESYLTDSGAAVFEHILLGKYQIRISNIDKQVALVVLDIKV